MNIYNMEQVNPPVEDNIGCKAVSTSVVAVDLFVLLSSPTGAHVVNIICDQTFYITFTNDGTTTITDPDETAVAGSGRTMMYPANTVITFNIGPSKRYCEVKATGSGYIRWYVEK